MKIRRNDKGSVLVWAVVIAAILSILIGAALTVSFSYFNRSVNNNTSKQAYFTSRSVVDAISSEIKNETQNGIAITNMLINVGDVVNLDNIVFSGEALKTSTTVAYVEFSEVDTIKITATTTIANQAKTVSALLLKGSGTSLPIGADFPGLDIPNDVTTVTSSVSISGSTTTNIYAKGAATVIFLNNADYLGTIYAESGSVINIALGSKFSGSICAQSGTIFTFSKLHNQFDGKIYIKDGAILNVKGKNYTIAKNGSTISVSPSGMDSDFKALLAIYTGTSTDTGWGDAYYE